MKRQSSIPCASLSVTLCAGAALVLAGAAHAREIAWKPKADLPRPMRGTAVTCGNRIYFVQASGKTSGVYAYDPAADAWEKKTNMITWGWNVNLAGLNGIVYAIGGDPFRDRNESYDPSSDTWMTLAPMPTPRQHSNCCVVNGQVYVLGGLEKGTMQPGDTIEDWAQKAIVSEKFEVYDPESNRWQTRTPLPTPRQGPGVALLNGQIYAIGGASTSADDSPASRVVETYGTKRRKWERKSDFPIPITAMAVVLSNDRLVVVGGQTTDSYGHFKPLDHVYVYDDKNDEWSRSTDLPRPIQVVSAAALGEAIYILGGCDGRFKPLKNVWCGTMEGEDTKPVVAGTSH